jgi:hypothetical protein
MLQHSCHIDDFTIIGQRPNPLNVLWNEWTLVVCAKCKKIFEWQHHSDEQAHGGDLEITAIVSPDYLRHVYGLEPPDVASILAGEKKIRCYSRYTHAYEERYA